jgi:hypothetical protein
MPEVIRLPPRSPNLNAFAERFVRSITSECLRRMIFIGQASPRHAIQQYLALGFDHGKLRFCHPLSFREVVYQ